MKAIITTEDNCIHVNDSLIPKNGSVVALMSNGVRLSGNWGSVDVLTENTEIDGVQAADAQSLFDFFKENSFSSGGTEPSVNGVQSINTSTAKEQKLAIGEAGAMPSWSTNAGTGVHTLNIPDASPTSAGIVTRGAQTFGGLKSFPDGVSVVEPQFPENPVNLAYFQVIISGLEARIQALENA